MNRNEIPTPSLLVDLDRFERNIARMARHADRAGKRLRPHAKTHRCLEIVRRQIAAGAIGPSCAKLGEAEVLVAGGIRGVLVTSEIVPPRSIARLMRLVHDAPDTIIVVDNADNVKSLAEAARSAGVILNVLIDVEMGDRRTGVAPGQSALNLAHAMKAEPSLRLRGLQGYAGGCGHVVEWSDRREASHKVMRALIETRHLLESRGFSVEIVSGTATGTYDIDTELTGNTELQCGSYCFMDIDYGHVKGRSGLPLTYDFEIALTVMTTLISVAEPTRGVVDAGFNAFSAEKPFPPQALNRLGITYEFAGDEHGRITLRDPNYPLILGERIEFVPPHCDPTVNHYDRIYAVRGNDVEAVWSVASRGRSD